MSVNICVATPSYKNTVSTHYASSMVSYTNVPGLKFRFVTTIGDSLITRARNRLFSRYQFEYNEQGYTHLFWQDDDIYVDGTGLLRISEYGLDVVGIAVPLKTDNHSRGIPCAVAGVYEEVAPMLYKTKYVGTGALLLSNKAIDALVDYCWDQKHYYYEVDTPNEIYDVFRTGTLDHFYQSEDWYLCDLLQKLGFDIYVDSSSLCMHSDSLNVWRREPMPIDRRALSEHFRSPLPESLQNSRWTPNDYRTPVPGAFK